MMTIHKISEEEIYKSASKFVTEVLSSNRKTLLLLSGGSAVNIYKRIANCELRLFVGKAGSKNLAFAQVDERFQPESNNPINQLSNYPISNENINANQIEKTGLWEMCRKNNIPYYLISQEGTLKEATRRYDQTISKLFKEYTYRLTILGIGEDGHTAGLLPGYKDVWNTDKYVVGYENIGKFPKRITLTPKALMELDQAIVVASGENKKEAIKKILNPVNAEKIDQYPAVLINKIKKVDLFT